MQNIPIKNGFYAIIPFQKKNYFFSIEKNSKDEFPLVEVNIKDKIMYFFFYYDQKDGYYLIIEKDTEKCLGILEDDNEMKLCLVQIRNDLRNKWKIISLNGVFNIQLKYNQFYITFINDSILKVTKRNSSNFQKFIFSKVSFSNKKYYPSEYSEYIKKIYNDTLSPEHVFNSFEIKSQQVKNIFSKKYITSVEIGKEALIIEDNSFNQFQQIKFVKCNPEYLKFFERRNLVTIIINEGTERIGVNDFKDCFNLINLTLPNSLKSIEEYSFNDCINLKNIIAPVKFYKYFNKTSFTLPKKEKILSASIFQNWISLKNVKLHSEVKEIEIGAFYNCESLEEIELPNGITVIPELAFMNCKNLKKIVIPDSVIDIHYTSFKGCNNLSTIICKEELKPKFVYTLEILDKIIHIGDYSTFSNIEYIEIGFDAQVDENFLSQFQFLKNIKCNPHLLKDLSHEFKGKITSFIVPEGIYYISNEYFNHCSELQYLELSSSVEIIEEGAFKSCNKITCLKCKADFLSHFNREKLQTIYILNNTDFMKDNTFYKCKNIKNIILPIKFRPYINVYFLECKKLTKISYINEQNKIVLKQPFRLGSNVEDNITIIAKEKYENWFNLATLVIPSSVIHIEENTFEKCYYLNNVTLNPMLIEYFVKERLEYITIPEFIEKVNENDFEGCINLKAIEFLGKDTKLEGNENKSFNKVKIIIGYPLIFITMNEKMKEKIKQVKLNKKCDKILFGTFKGYKSLTYINIPNSVTDIEDNSFEGCISLSEISIPDTVKNLSQYAFNNCKNLIKINCHPKFFKSFFNNSIKEISLSNESDDFNLEYFFYSIKEFKYLEKIDIPATVTKVPNNVLGKLPNITSIKCSPILLKNLNKEDKKYIKEIEIIEGFKIDSQTFDGFDSVYNFILPGKELFINKFIAVHKTSVEDLEVYDPINKKYSKHIKYIENECNKTILNNIILNNQNSLEGISSRIAEICFKIKTKSKKKFTPHVVQILSVLRLADSIINKCSSTNKGAIAEIKTGEGKSYIISILSILLAKYYKRLIDIVTSTIELARRDNEEQGEFYKLFNVKSGVLFSLDEETDFIDIDNIDNKRKFNNTQKNEFNYKVLDNEIVYSTNYNFQFVYLLSLFRNKSFRSRSYDLVIVDEVDNMFIDQSNSPAIIANQFPIAYANDILEIVYILQNQSIYDIKKVLTYFFPDNVAYFTDDRVNLLKRAALSASQMEYNVNYIIEKNEIVIIDETTGYKKPGQRWENFIHEMVEIKEGLSPKKNEISFCSITQMMFFNLYKQILGVTGTIGDVTDEKILKEAYNVNIFKIPRNLPPRKPIYYEKRPNNKGEIFQKISEEIFSNQISGRPVLVIFDNLKNLKQFIQFIKLAGFQFKTIEGMNSHNDKNALENAGKSKQITIATSAAGRGMDIKLSKEALQSGGLHVIIPFAMPNKRVLDQAVGRSARQGQPGSATIYISNNDRFNSPPQIKPLYENLVKLQNEFSKYLKKSYPWLYSYNNEYSLDYLVFPFGLSTKKVLQIYDAGIKEKEINPKNEYAKQVYSNFFNDMIFKSWGLFYSDIKNQGINDYSECDKKYKEFLNDISSFIPPNTSLENQIAKYAPKNKFGKFILIGIELTSFACCLIFPLNAPIIMIGTTLLTGGIKVYQKLRRGEEVNWGGLLLELLGKTLTGLCIPGTGKLGEAFSESFVGQYLIKELEFSEKIVKNIANFAGKSLGEYLCCCAEGNTSIKNLATIFINNGLEFFYADTLKKIGNKFMKVVEKNEDLKKIIKKGKDLYKKFIEIRKENFFIDEIFKK